MRCLGFLFVVCVGSSVGAAAQDLETEQADYFRAVSGFFRLPANEIAILSDWQISPDEIPVVLFIASRAGISPEALVALRSAGLSWDSLADRYRVTAATLHVSIPDDAFAGVLADAYDSFRQVPVGEWRTIHLADAEIIALVNVRVIAQSLGIPSETVIRRTGSVATFVELYSQLKR